MITTCKLTLLTLLVMVIAVPVMGVPNTGAATVVNSNNVTIPLTGCVGESYVLWGQASGAYMWNTPNTTPVGGSTVSVIWGAPLTGGTYYYAVGCDSTGCGNEITFTTASVTPLPTTTFGAGFTNLTRAHFNPLFIAPMIEQVYAPQSSNFGFPRAMLYGLLLSLIFIGLWLRTRSIRMVSTLGMITGGMIFLASTGLKLGVPGEIQLLGMTLLIAGVAGWVVVLWQKK